jgi:hypothetical protein
VISKYDEQGGDLYPCGCIKAKVLGTGHYYDQTEAVSMLGLHLGLATNCFDERDLEESSSRTLH